MIRPLFNRNFSANALTLISAAALVAVGGVIAGAGDIQRATLVVGVFTGALLLYKPASLLWFVIAGGLLLAGFTQLYVPQMQFIRWPIALLSAVLGVLAILRYAYTQAGDPHRRLSPVFWWMAAFFVVTSLSSLFNYEGVETLAFGLKGYFQVFGLFVAIVMFAWPARLVDRLPKAVTAIAFLQLPFALHQYLFLVPKRLHLGYGIIPEDVVAGTMGASEGGGGANAVLSLLLLVAIAILTASFRRGALAPSRFAAGVLILVLPILLNANKIAILYLVLLFLLLFATEIFRRPGKFIMGATLCAAAVMAIGWSYTSLLSTAERTTDWRELATRTIDSNTLRGHGLLTLNRATVIGYWLDEHQDGELPHLLFGHGAGASREGGVVAASTLAQRAYGGIGIGLTTVSSVLWETGVVGLVVLCLILWSMWRAAGRLARIHTDDVWRSSVFVGFQAATVLFAMSFMHKNSFVFHLPFQTLFMIMAGYIAFWDSRAMNDEVRSARLLAVSADNDRGSRSP